jgi:type II secretory pathway pseudopilin PulG
MQRLLRHLGRRLADERGITLVLALGIMVVIGIASVSAATYARANSGQTRRSSADLTAHTLAEAGANLAYSALKASSSPTLPSALPSTPAAPIAMNGGTVSYYGAYDSSTQVWTLTGVGTAPNPAAPGTTIVRESHLRARIGTGTVGGASNAAWRYIYSDDPNSCASLSNNTRISVPVYVQGSLCLNNSAVIDGPAVQVGGTVTLNNTQTSIGTAASPMAEIHIARGCSLTGTSFTNPCSTAQRVYGQVIDTTTTPLSKPPIDLAYWYANSMPGPLHPCTFGSFPGGFDNDTVRNRSLRSSVDLTPRNPYDCRVYDASGALVARLAWTPGAPGTLVIQGTIYFDGDITMAQLTQAQYQGVGTIYTSGTISLQNQVNLCPLGGCGPNWDPNANLLTFVAGS